MSRKTSRTPQLTLTHGQGRFVVELEAFFDLSFTMAEELENLVDDWAYFVRKRPQRADRVSATAHRVKH